VSLKLILEIERDKSKSGRLMWGERKSRVDPKVAYRPPLFTDIDFSDFFLGVYRRIPRTPHKVKHTDARLGLGGR